jgi:hypothetical protein
MSAVRLAVARCSRWLRPCSLHSQPPARPSVESAPAHFACVSSLPPQSPFSVQSKYCKEEIYYAINCQRCALICLLRLYASWVCSCFVLRFLQTVFAAVPLSGLPRVRCVSCCALCPCCVAE